MQCSGARIIRIAVLVACYTTQHPALSVCLSARHILRFLCFFILWLRPKCSSDLKYDPYPPICDWDNRVSGLVLKQSQIGSFNHPSACLSVQKCKNTHLGCCGRDCVFMCVPPSFQIVVGQYSKLGPLGIWRSFPLARGIGVVWIFLSAITVLNNTIYASKSLVFLGPVCTYAH